MRPKRIISPAQADAARANGAKSRGPVTEAGKRHSSRNATRHGLLSSATLLPGEVPERFEALLAGYLAEHQPRTPTELDLVEEMVTSRWRKKRILDLERARIAHHIKQSASLNHGVPVDDPATAAALAICDLADTGNGLQLFRRYETGFGRQFHRAFAEYMTLRRRPDSDSGPAPGPSGLNTFKAPSGLNTFEAPPGLANNEAPAGLTNNEAPSGLTNNEAPWGLTNNVAPSGLTSIEAPAGLTKNAAPSDSAASNQPISVPPSPLPASPSPALSLPNRDRVSAETSGADCLPPTVASPPRATPHPGLDEPASVSPVTAPPASAPAESDSAKRTPGMHENKHPASSPIPALLLSVLICIHLWLNLLPAPPGVSLPPLLSATVYDELKA